MQYLDMTNRYFLNGNQLRIAGKERKQERMALRIISAPYPGAIKPVAEPNEKFGKQPVESDVPIYNSVSSASITLLPLEIQ